MVFEHFKRLGRFETPLDIVVLVDSKSLGKVLRSFFQLAKVTQMTFGELTELWCFGEGSVWWWLSNRNELACLVDGVQTNVVVRDGLNARAISSGGTYAVEFRDEVGPLLVELYQKMLAAHARRGVVRAILGLSHRDGDHRDAIALRLARITVDFIVLHEICHIARGHFAKADLVDIAEFSDLDPSLSPQTRSALESRVCEADADVCALALLSAMMKPMSSHVHRYRFTSDWQGERTVRFALFTFFHLSSGNKPLDVVEYEKDAETTHPHPAIRAQILKAYFARTVDRTDRWFHEPIASWSSSAMLKLSAALVERTGRKVPLFGQVHHQRDYINYRGNAILEIRDEASSTWLPRSRWQEMDRRLTEAANFPKKV